MTDHTLNQCPRVITGHQESSRGMQGSNLKVDPTSASRQRGLCPGPYCDNGPPKIGSRASLTAASKFEVAW